MNQNTFGSISNVTHETQVARLKGPQLQLSDSKVEQRFHPCNRWPTFSQF